jgi:hypothetical protein
MQYIKDEVTSTITTIREMHKRQLISQVINLGKDRVLVITSMRP